MLVKIDGYTKGIDTLGSRYNDGGGYEYDGNKIVVKPSQKRNNITKD